jgi:hypothetical protein
MSKYFLQTHWKYIYSIIEMLGIGFILGMAVYFLRFFLLFYFITWLYRAFWVIHRVRNEHITINKEGIEYRTPWIAYKGEWEDFETGKHWSIFGKQEGLFADKSQINLLWHLEPYGMYAGLSQRVFIPLNCFSENWRDSDLGQQIKQYAPHLFVQDQENS